MAYQNKETYTGKNTSKELSYQAIIRFLFRIISLQLVHSIVPEKLSIVNTDAW